MPRIVLAVAAMIGLAVFRLGRVVLGATALWMIAGPPWSLLALAALLLRWTLPLRLGVFLGAVLLWHWPWFTGLLLAAPRPFLMLPGYVSTRLAMHRHPRPLWHPLQPAGP